MHKKAQGISLETIVVAVIVLFVLAVLLLVFTGRISIFGLGLKDCNTVQGQCMAKSTIDVGKPCGETRALMYQGRCPGEQVCCSAVTSDIK